MTKTYKPLTPTEKITVGVLVGALSLTSAIMVSDTIASQDNPTTLSATQIEQSAELHEQKIQTATPPVVVANTTENLEPPESIRVEYTFEPMVIRASAVSSSKPVRTDTQTNSDATSVVPSAKPISPIAIATEKRA